MAAMTKALMCIIVIMIAGAVTTPAQAQFSCGVVVQYLRPCYPYLTNRGPLLGGCCGRFKSVFAAAKTTSDRRIVCGCLKSLSSSNPGVSFVKVAGLPRQCGVNIPYKIIPTTDCSKIN